MVLFSSITSYWFSVFLNHPSLTRVVKVFKYSNLLLFFRLFFFLNFVLLKIKLFPYYIFWSQFLFFIFLISTPFQLYACFLWLHVPNIISQSFWLASYFSFLMRTGGFSKGGRSFSQMGAVSGNVFLLKIKNFWKTRDMFYNDHFSCHGSGMELFLGSIMSAYWSSQKKRRMFWCTTKKILLSGVLALMIIFI